ncbi:MAG: PilZ domain-containing protein [Labilithrix sp.]|nr:PilZ domain-containing protein [Labilithrix sp.]
MNLALPVSPAPSAFVHGGVRPSRRIATRREVLLPCQAVRERDFKLLADRTLDVSVDGLLLPVNEHILTGETLIVSFPIPGTWIDAEATVTRVVHGRRPGDDGLAIGVLFDVISPASRAALAGFLHGRPPPLPRRGPLARMRRGAEAPRLADELTMDLLVGPEQLASLDDIEDLMEEESALPALSAEEQDALGILREVAAAWKRLVVSND